MPGCVHANTRRTPRGGHEKGRITDKEPKRNRSENKKKRHYKPEHKASKQARNWMRNEYDGVCVVAALRTLRDGR